MWSIAAFVAGSSVPDAGARKPSPVSPIRPFCLPASATALSSAVWASAGAATPASVMAAPRAMMALLNGRRVMVSSEEVRVLLDQGLHFLIQLDADVGVQLGVDVDRLHLHMDGRRAGRHEAGAAEDGAKRA